MLEGGIPLTVLNTSLREAAHLLYVWKFLILAVVIVLSMMINRPFCKYMCPLGAFYGLFHRFSFMKLSCDHEVCISCGACAKVCGMQVNPVENPNSAECIRCGDCVKVCPVNALSLSMVNKEKK